ncbi:MAG TPA: oligopeptide/dipeptide ABC transporter ATP-binding protein [Alphaproteobacteria bacterium]|jgi:oligopeptide/dipeptide ABC transporter ATP-binding protein|nr:oligopeptide/dipeptide ABC transporter ATP-binding protein [Alphaproteobacteria bacterium]
MSELLLEARNLVKHFPVAGEGVLWRERLALHAVDGVDLAITRGETVAVIGESGCGKTTLARVLAGLYPASAGSVQFAGVELERLGRGAMRRFRRAVQMIFQDPFASLDPRMTAGGIIGEPFAIHSLGNRGERRDWVSELLEVVGLSAQDRERYPHEFSGGQRQRIGIARALALAPELLIADEPVSALDVSIQSQILNLLRDLIGDRELAMLFITHDLAVVDFIADRVAVMYLGVIVESGPRTSVLDTPRHPYTQALRAAVPEVGRGKRHQGTALAGEVPSPVAPPSGCRFHTRCPLARDICRSEVPLLEPIGDSGHAVACHIKVDGA